MDGALRRAIRIEALLADKGYDADAIRAELAAAGAEAVIPTKSNRRTRIPHDRAKYRWRNLVERLFSKLKNWRRIATRYDKTKESYLGFVALASIKLWTLCPRPPVSVSAKLKNDSSFWSFTVQQNIRRNPTAWLHSLPFGPSPHAI